MKGDSVAFFVEGSKAAEALKKVSHKITVRDGSKVCILCLWNNFHSNFCIISIYWALKNLK